MYVEHIVIETIIPVSRKDSELTQSVPHRKDIQLWYATATIVAQSTKQKQGT